MNAKTKATNIPKSVKKAVWLRQKGVSLWSGLPITESQCCCHLISRSKGGLGVEENIIGLTHYEHQVFDRLLLGWSDKLERQHSEMRAKAIEHMKTNYDGWSKEKVTYGRNTRIAK